MVGYPIRALGAVLLGVFAAASATAEDDVRIALTRADCSRLVAHTPAADVEYRPGVDVRGRPVPPADLGGGYDVALPETIVIDIEVDLFGRFGIPADPDLYDADAEVGTVVVRGGRAYLNGRPFLDDEQAALAARCQKVLRDKE